MRGIFPTDCGMCVLYIKGGNVFIPIARVGVVYSLTRRSVHLRRFHTLPYWVPYKRVALVFRISYMYMTHYVNCRLKHIENIV